MKSKMSEELYFVNRWYDDAGVPHYFGILAGQFETFKDAQAGVVFNVIDTPVDLVYGPCTLQECYAFMGDCLVNRPDDDLSDIGTLDWNV